MNKMTLKYNQPASKINFLSIPNWKSFVVISFVVNALFYNNCSVNGEHDKDNITSHTLKHCYIDRTYTPDSGTQAHTHARTYG